jgi:hypothetical protein
MSEPIDEFRKADLETELELVHAEAINRFAVLQDRERHSRYLATKDKVHLEAEGGAWADSGVDVNNIEGSSTTTAPEPPRYTIDRVTPVLEQALSDQRENKIQIQVRSTTVGNSKSNDTMNGLIKNIESISDASYVYDNSFDETQKCGYGGWQIVTEYADDSFDQEIRIRPIKDAANSLWFGKSDMYTKEDALHAFVIWYEDIKEFQAQYPESMLVDMPEDNIGSFIGMNGDWCDGDLIRLAAYWRKKPVKKEIVMMTDDTIHNVDEDFESILDELAEKGITFKTDSTGKEMRRKVDSYEVERYIMNGAEILVGPQRWPGKYIPLVPEFGVQTTILGKELVRGRVRKTIDSSTVYNYCISGAVQQTAISPQDILMITREQADGSVAEIQNLNVSGDPALLYTHVDNQPAPFRTQSRPIDMALIGVAQTMAENIAATVGGNVGSVMDGTAIDPRSGEAILQGQAVSEKGNAIYMANHIRSVAYCGKILADLLPRIKSGESQERIVNPDNSTEFVYINQTQKNLQDGEDVILNDLSAAKYDTVTDVGPAYASKRQQASAMMQSMAEKNPAFASRPDLIVKGIDLGDGGEMYEALRKDLIMKGLVEPTDEEREEFQIDEREQMKQQLIPELIEQLTSDANVRLINANAMALESQALSTEDKIERDNLKQQAEAQSAAIKDISESMKSFKTQMDALETQQKLGIAMSVQDRDNLVTTGEVIEDSLQVIQQGPNGEQLQEFEQAISQQPMPPTNLL